MEYRSVPLGSPLVASNLTVDTQIVESPSQNRAPDLLVIGSGAAGFAAAIRGRELGASVVMIERSTVGGTCVNVGCVPSKMLLATAGRLWNQRQTGTAVAMESSPSIDLGAIQSEKRRLVDTLRQKKYLDVAEHFGFDIIEGAAAFVDARTVAVGDRRFTPRAVLIATGSTPMLPGIDGIDAVEVLTSTSAMELERVPDELVVIGGGFVGLEQAQLWSRLGSRVTLVGRIAPHAEPELALRLATVLGAEGITLVFERAVGVAATPHGVRVDLQTGRSVSAARLLVATGRRPRTDGLRLGAAGVGLNAKGSIRIRSWLQTTNPIVWAAGDVAGDPQFVYVASAQGAVAAQNALTGSRTTVDLAALPEVIFTDPQFASAGVTESQARAAGIRTDSRVLDLSSVPRALVESQPEGAIKLVADADTGQVLGVHLLARGAGEVILAGVYAIAQKVTVNDLAQTWAPYLTMGESLRLVAQSFTRDPTKLSCCA